MKKLHIALDLESTEDCKKLLEKVAKYVDIIELGSPMMIAEGAKSIKEIKDLYPNKFLFADTKIMDGGEQMSGIALAAGADMVSVLAASSDSTIKEVIANANKYQAKVLVDMCSVKDISDRAKIVDQFGPEYVCVHVGYDMQGKGQDPIEEVKYLDGIKSKKAAAGGIRLETFESACKADIDDIIVGGGLTHVENPKATAKKMFDLIEQYR
jgi:3-hexulose-6-phosphate synthase